MIVFLLQTFQKQVNMVNQEAYIVPFVLLFHQADIDNSGTIDYIEFIAATLHLNKLEREEHLVAAFSYFDKDGSGYITVDELQQACKEHNMPDAFLDDVINEADQDNVSIVLIPPDVLYNYVIYYSGIAGMCTKMNVQAADAIKFVQLVKTIKGFALDCLVLRWKTNHST
jgi:hypothetical protein